jgi:hypothetical protein
MRCTPATGVYLIGVSHRHTSYRGVYLIRYASYGHVSHTIYALRNVYDIDVSLSRAFYCEKAAFRLLLAGPYRFSYIKVAEGSTGQAPAGKVASGSKIGRVYI